MFTPSRDEALRQEWIRQIPNANLQLNTLVYVKKHFTVEEGSLLYVIVDKQVSTVLRPQLRNIITRRCLIVM